MEEYQVMIQSREWLVGWGTLSLINAGLAQGKNRSGLIWWILSLIFGPLATLVLVLLSKAPANPHD
ncbi:antitermination protein NusB [Microbulbifer agarilyticus]|uniref:antitermination protein NusB n=1 Tax=Microbulbifer agarilyticus TaxID=260552 RepID=UPI001CD1B6F4|nr:antitermination protein NusB [Microbulbifer agarilyticus]MCA0899740.1 antitermination protein NusB [Microbulbifer agarilyticus]